MTAQGSNTTQLRIAMGVEPASIADLDEAQIASWMQQAATMPFAGGKKR